MTNHVMMKPSPIKRDHIRLPAGAITSTSFKFVAGKWKKALKAKHKAHWNYEIAPRLGGRHAYTWICGDVLAFDPRLTSTGIPAYHIWEFVRNIPPDTIVEATILTTGLLLNFSYKEDGIETKGSIEIKPKTATGGTLYSVEFE